MNIGAKDITFMQAYLAMCEFLNKEMELNGKEEVHLGGLLSEMELDKNGESSDPGALAQFKDAVQKVLTEGSKFDIK